MGSSDGRRVVGSVEVFDADDVAILIEKIEPVMCHYHALQKTMRFEALGERGALLMVNKSLRSLAD